MKLKIRALGYLVCAFATVILASTSAFAQKAQPTTEDDIREHIAILASDEFAGRDPGTIGEEKTIAYLAQQWAEAGMVSGTGNPDSPWFQPVPLAERKPLEKRIKFTHGGKRVKVNKRDILISSPLSSGRASGEIVFVGYGTDVKGKVAASIKGKIALMLFGSPAGSEEFPSRDERIETLIKAGANAVLVISSPRFPWPVLLAQARRGSYVLNSQQIQPPIQGRVNKDFLKAIFKPTGNTFKAESQKALALDYSGFATGVFAEFEVDMEIREFTSHNVIGKFPGKTPGAGALLFLGHWDHFGLCRPVGAGDRICNGAVDNASGLAVLTEVAEELGKLAPFDRDIYFMGTTAEERGLLGAYHFAENPPVRLEDIVIALNIDTVAIAKRGAKVAIIGRGETDLDDVIDNVTRSLGREPELSTESNSFIRRQDGWALASKGVPALMAGGSFADFDLLNRYLRGRYHGPDDELKKNTELGGAAEDTDLHVALGRYFASLTTYPGKVSEAAD